MTNASFAEDMVSKTDHRARVVVLILAGGAVTYAAGAISALRGSVDLGSAIEVFFSGAIPGLAVILLLWALRPAVYGPRHRRVLVGVTLIGAAAMPVLSFLVAWAVA